jgi:hypothetical protein
MHLGREEDDPEQHSQKADTVNLTRHKPVRRSLGSIGCWVNRSLAVPIFTHRCPLAAPRGLPRGSDGVIDLNLDIEFESRRRCSAH